MSYQDSIMSAYFNIVSGRLNEMADVLNRGDINDIDSQHTQDYYGSHIPAMTLDGQIEGHKIYKKQTNVKDIYLSKSPSGHISCSVFLNKGNPSSHCNELHFWNELVSQSKKDSVPGLARKIMWHHFEKTKSPLVTSYEQSIEGHKMWRKLAHEALDKGHSVEYFDGTKSNKTTKENIETHLDSYFGKDDENGMAKSKYLIVRHK